MYKPHLARADEPFFVLLGRDDVAPHFARAYGYYLQGQVALAQDELSRIGSMVAQVTPLASHHDKVRSCFTIADEMTAYRRSEVLRLGIG